MSSGDTDDRTPPSGAAAGEPPASVAAAGEERGERAGADKERGDKERADRDRGDKERGDRERGDSWLGGYARRFIKAGADAILDREEILRRFVPELPREMASYLLRVGEDARDDILRIFGRELRRFLETLNLGEELQKILTSTSFEIKTEIRFIPNDEAVGGVKPDIKKQVSVKVNREEKA